MTEKHAELIIEEKDDMYNLLRDYEYERYRVHEDWESFYNGQNKSDWMNCYTEEIPFLK